VRLSREARSRVAAWITGDRAEMSNDRLYESKDSREMLKGSFSSYAHLLIEDDVVDRDDAVPQKDLRSEVGEGGR